MQGLPFPIITYQVITGNYSGSALADVVAAIITYQVITGNYSPHFSYNSYCVIITYQVITGNYSCSLFMYRPLFHYNIPSNNRELQLTVFITDD